MNVFETRVQNVIKRIIYKDWAFHIGKDGIGLYYMQIRFVACDPQSKPHAEWAGRKWRLSTFMTDSEIVQTALKAVLAAEEHEAREAFLYRGRAIFGPHFNVDRLWELSGDPEAKDVRP